MIYIFNSPKSIIYQTTIVDQTILLPFQVRFSFGVRICLSKVNTVFYRGAILVSVNLQI